MASMLPRLGKRNQSVRGMEIEQKQADQIKRTYYKQEESVMIEDYLIMIVLILASWLYILWSDRKFWKEQDELWERLKDLEEESDDFYKRIKKMTLDDRTND